MELSKTLIKLLEHCLKKTNGSVSIEVRSMDWRSEVKEMRVEVREDYRVLDYSQSISRSVMRCHFLCNDGAKLVKFSNFPNTSIPLSGVIVALLAPAFDRSWQWSATCSSTTFTGWLPSLYAWVLMPSPRHHLSHLTLPPTILDPRLVGFNNYIKMDSIQLLIHTINSDWMWFVSTQA